MDKEKFLILLNQFLSEMNISKQLSWDDNFKDVAIDSLDLMRLIIKFEEKYGVTLPEEELMKLNTPLDLFNLCTQILHK